jgi:hypothetical protein
MDNCKIPKQIKLGWRIYSIGIGKRTHDKENETTWGEIDYERCRIFLNEDGSDETMKATLLHEIVHWIWYNSGQTKLRENEGAVECITNHLMMIFRDNPELAKTLFQGGEPQST